ncbi:MAG: hypothetical protein WC889_10260 [Myxococcota bacterium]
MSHSTKRVLIALGMGALLGVFCIVGVGSRVGFDGNGGFLFSIWYNRLLMGLVIGLAGGVTMLKSRKANIVLRGLLLGTLVSLASSLSTGFRDVPSFFAGMVYGPIIDAVASWLADGSDVLEQQSQK